MKLTQMITCTLLLAGAAAAQDVAYNFDQQADFSRYKTYKWVEIPGGHQVDELTTKQLTDAFQAGLGTKGLTKTDSDTADLFVGYQLAISQEKQLNTYTTGGGYGPGWRGGWYGGAPTMTTGSTTTILIGTVALDMYDGSTKNLVWRGVASKTIDTKAKPEKRQKNINKGVQKMLKNYPPQKKS